MANYNIIDIAGVEGNMQAEPRVFAHSAKALTIPSGASEFVGVVGNFTSPTDPNDPAQDGDSIRTLRRGACLYVGNGGNVKVQMEDFSIVTFYNVANGSFLPILAIKVYGSNTGAETDGTTATNILALF
jgi:hypothetical protein